MHMILGCAGSEECGEETPGALPQENWFKATAHHHVQVTLRFKPAKSNYLTIKS